MRASWKLGASWGWGWGQFSLTLPTLALPFLSPHLKSSSLLHVSHLQIPLHLRPRYQFEPTSIGAFQNLKSQTLPVPSLVAASWPPALPPSRCTQSSPSLFQPPSGFAVSPPSPRLMVFMFHCAFSIAEYHAVLSRHQCWVIPACSEVPQTSALVLMSVLTL